MHFGKMADMAFGEGSFLEFRWTDEHTAALIHWRGSNSQLFTGRRNAAQRGFEEFVKQHNLVGKIEPLKVKRKWENLKQKYKDLKASKLGMKSECGESAATSWKWHGPMEEALGKRPSVTPSVVVPPVLVPPVLVPPVLADAKRRRQDFVTMLKAWQERDQERERMYLEREEKREREVLVREEKREQEWREWEERKAREHREWEERIQRENREREDRREREIREREERREQEFQAREDRLVSLIKLFLEKK
ncbi:ensconsin [Amia ocellicauda]|uniref:ensconsin n=1 Tax=Amia ocellicauda TaxID=2972642 RepID=UPI003463E404